MPKFYLFFLIFAFLPAPAHATCINPVGDHGDMLYNRDHTVMQYCNGTNWISMDASRSGGSDNLGNHTATKDLDMADFKVKNAAIPTASKDLTNKAYVDAAVAAAAGSGGDGGGGATCYYISVASACGTGFSEMPGQMAFLSGYAAKVCCTLSTSNSVTDDSPAPFDFPDTPNTVGTGAYTWDPIQLTDFDTAPVQISAPVALGTPGYRICADAACSNVIKAWRSTSTGVANGNYLQIRIGTGSRNTFNKAVTITVGALSDTARVRGGAWGVFLTAGTYNGNLGGIAGADSKCQTEATNAGYPGTWRAWISDGTSSPSTRFENKNTSSYFMNQSEQAVAFSWADLTDGAIAKHIGTFITNVWTNTTTSGTVLHSSYSCNGWTNATTSYNAYYGLSNYADTNWTYNSNTNCSQNHALYCFQTVQ